MVPMENEQAKTPALPLLALLAMASALGAAVAVALAGVAMLLAAPAYAGESREEGEAVRTRVVEVSTTRLREPG